ncbi:MAG TPA: IS110 family transposase [Phormidium sp.]
MYKYTGIDISKQTFDANITTPRGVEAKKFSNDATGFTKLLKLLPTDAHVVMEASGPYYYRLAFFLHEQGVRVSVVNPLVIRRFCQMLMIRTKTDKKDASMIREYAISQQPALWQPDVPMITKLKQLNAALDLLEKQITAFRNQLEAFEQMPDTDGYTLKQLEQLISQNKQVRGQLQAQMEEVVGQHYQESYQALRSIPGIGPKAAAMLIAITGNFTKFSCYRQLVAYVGLNPNIFESGTSVKGKGHISKMGTARLRKILYLCSWSAKKYNEPCQQMYERLKARAKPEKVIKVALANKLLRQAFAIGKNVTAYRQNHQPNLDF